MLKYTQKRGKVKQLTNIFSVNKFTIFKSCKSNAFDSPLSNIQMLKYISFTFFFNFQFSSCQLSIHNIANMTNWSRSSLIYNMYCHNAPMHQAGLFSIHNLCLAETEFRMSLEHRLSLSMCTVASLTLDESQNCSVLLSRIQTLTLKNFPVFHTLLARLI